MKTGKQGFLCNPRELEDRDSQGQVVCLRHQTTEEKAKQQCLLDFYSFQQIFPLDLTVKPSHSITVTFRKSAVDVTVIQQGSDGGFPSAD